MSNIIIGKVFVVGDNIDTDQIIPANYLTLVPTNPDEYEKLGSYALIGLPDSMEERYVKDGEMKTEYPIIIGGKNYGCGSSREHAPISMGAAGCKAVVAETFARIFFRNCISTGELYPVQAIERIVEQFTTGEEVTLDIDNSTITKADGTVVSLKPMGDVKDVIDNGGIFEHARKTGMIKK